jgi:hypothetical protein
MSMGEGEDVFINEYLVARKDPDREAWEITQTPRACLSRARRQEGRWLPSPETLREGVLQRGDLRLARDSRSDGRGYLGVGPALRRGPPDLWVRSACHTFT